MKDDEETGSWWVAVKDVVSGTAPRTPADRTKPPPGWHRCCGQHETLWRDQPHRDVSLTEAWVIYDREHGALHQKPASPEANAHINAEMVSLIREIVGNDVTFLDDAVLELKRERDAAADRVRVLEAELHRDQTGLAAAMSEVRGLARSYDWLGDPDAWGSYDYTERTVATLRKEIGWCFEAMRKVIDDALHASGRIAQLALSPTAAPIPEEEPPCTK